MLEVECDRDFPAEIARVLLSICEARTKNNINSRRNPKTRYKYTSGRQKQLGSRGKLDGLVRSKSRVGDRQSQFGAVSNRSDAGWILLLNFTFLFTFTNGRILNESELRLL